MKSRLFILVLFLLTLTGCINNDESQIDSEQISMSDMELLSTYLSEENARQLLLDTWGTIEQIYLKTDLERSDFVELESYMFEVYVDQLYNLLTESESDFRRIPRYLSLPLITDEEVEIIDYKVRELVNNVVDYELIITEQGSYDVLDLEFTRNNHYSIDESGQVKLYKVTGELGLRSDLITEGNLSNNTYLLMQYLDDESARDLLEKTWKNIINESRRSDLLFDADRVYEQNVYFAPFLLDNTIKMITKLDESETRTRVKELFIPTILDDEVSITNVEINYIGSPEVTYELIITEGGEYRDRGIGFERKNHFYVNEDGSLLMYHYSGYFATGNLNLPSNQLPK